MFSALRHYAPTEYRLKSNPAPNNFTKQSVALDSPNVVGQNRFKYFRRPIVPYVSTFTGQVVYSKKIATMIGPNSQRAASPFQKTVAIQTLYRYRF